MELEEYGIGFIHGNKKGALYEDEIYGYKHERYQGTRKYNEAIKDAIRVLDKYKDRLR